MSTLIATIRRWRRTRIITRHPVDEALWHRVTAEIDALAGLNEAELGHLRELVALFLHSKRFYGTHELVIDEFMRIAVAAQACLLVLNLDAALETEVYPGWASIILYPGAFVARHDYRDGVGVVHERIMALDGEASHRGPVVLSWQDARPGAESPGTGRNVVLHEFAHKLDFLDGTSNGHPPLHADMSTKIWAAVFSAAFGHFSHLVEQRHHTPFNPYAATNPAEFFAVVTEVFFLAPHKLKLTYPEVYDQLARYYRQDPAGRREPHRD
ncbi:MAG: zinc-dependent peptidase [Pseudomonadales bacterium]